MSTAINLEGVRCLNTFQSDFFGSVCQVSVGN